MSNTMNLNQIKFQTEVDHKKTDLFFLSNNSRMEMAVTNYGAKIVALMIKNKNGKAIDVVLGHDSIQDYINSEEAYFGSICGRYANRIAKGKFTLDNKEYTLAVNNGPNALHGGIKGFNAVVWDAVQRSENTLELTYTSKDGEEGYPGNLEVKVIYELTDQNELVIRYFAHTDKPTVLNLTNHSYFNLSGAGDPYIGDHTLRINAESYLPTDETSIPYGNPEKVAGTPFDFRNPHTIGERIDEQVEQLIWARGYDHTYILNKGEDAKIISFAAECSSPKSNIKMEIYTTEPGVQVYTGNWMSGNMRGKHDQRYPARAAVCFETQHFPDSPNKPEYPSTVLRPNEEFQSITAFKFSDI